MAPSLLRQQIFNPERTRAPGDAHFHKFPLLPKEIRLQVWERALGTPNRIIAVHPPRDGVPDKVAASRVHGRRINSRLLRVCKEARSVVQAFYRVHLPCTMQREDGECSEDQVFYFNPEHDVLNFDLISVGLGFAHFLHRLVQLDPRGVGLCRIALAAASVSRPENISMSTEELGQETRDTFINVLSRLQEVLFLTVESTGRLWMTYLTGLRDQLNVVEYHATPPLWCSEPSFERIGLDPRDCAQDLKRVFTGSFNPQQAVLTWFAQLANWGVTPDPKASYRVAFACKPPGSRSLTDRESVQKYLPEEEESWQGGFKQLADEGTEVTYGPAKEQNTSKTAAGFWMFPIEALGPFPKEGEDPRKLRGMKVVDMSEHWPELALFNI
ncbi:hypothetical protein LIA77_08198 [Sarocladium implicatum]|nr:hypothetical protein LIA77_08198 [Sarocladium implicatum]